MTLARTSPAAALQKAFYIRLTTDIKKVPIFDTVPQGQKTPYVIIGEDFSTPDDTKTGTGEILTTTTHAWSDTPGKKEVKGIIAAIEAAIFRADLDLAADGFKVLKTTLDEKQNFTDENGTTQHGVIKIAFQIEKN
jgi:hypothetical protein